MEHLIIGIVAGALTGNIPGRVARHLDLGRLGNTITGALGGLIGQSLVGNMALGASTGGGMDLYSIGVSAITGALGGGVLTTLGGLVRSRLAK